MSHLPNLYREVYKIDRVKGCNLRITIDTKHIHPFADHGRLQAFAARNGKRLERTTFAPKRYITLAVRKNHAIS